MSVSPAPNPRLQLRIDFDGTPTRGVEMILELVGTRVHVDITGGMPSDAWAYLVAAGISARIEENSPILFGVEDLPKLTSLPEQVRVIAVSHLRPLWNLASAPPEGGLPVTVHLEAGELSLRWFDGDAEWTERISPSAIPAFLVMGYPFVAEHSAWDILLSASELPPRVGKARINLDGFCEITASAPQLVESAPIPGLFRITPTMFGVPARYASKVAELRGFTWEGRHAPKTAPVQLPETWVELRPHLRSQVPQIAASLVADGGHVISWSSGLARRLAALTAIEALEAYPALVVCPPWRVWLWQRQIDELGRSSSMVSKDRSDITITTYHDLSIRTDNLAPVAVIFDDPASSEARAALPSLRALTSAYPDAFRLVLTTALPSDPVELCRFMELARPGEFAFTGPLNLRYPGDSHLQLKAHASCYYSSISAEDIPSSEFPASASVTVCDPPESLLVELERIRTDTTRSLRSRLAASLEVISLGSGPIPSPKLARALAFMRSAVVRNKKAAVLVTHSRTASMLRIGIQPAAAEVAEGTGAQAAKRRALAEGGSGLLILHMPSAKVDLTDFDEVLVYDYPWNLGDVDEMIGSSATTGPCHLEILHLLGTPDDRLSLSAALRRSRSHTDPSASHAPSSEEEVAYLLAPRYARTHNVLNPSAVLQTTPETNRL